MTGDETSRANLPAEGVMEKRPEDPLSCPSSSYPVLSEETSGRKPFATVDHVAFLKYGDPEKGSLPSDRTIYIEFAEGDDRNPANFSLLTKWTITAMACIFSVFHQLRQPITSIGLSVFALGFGSIPMVTASFTEEFGRHPLYIGSGIGFLLTYAMVALSRNIHTVILARFLQGSFGSAGATMVGGTIADIWSPRDRGMPMSIFSVAIIGGLGIGPMVSGWIEMNPRLEWRWIQWYQMIFFSVFLVLVPVLMKETRSSVLLTRLAKNVRKETGNDRYRARIEEERPPLRTLIYISCTRPIILMFTEPLVLSFSLWVSLAWGVVYCLIDSISGVFATLHGFNIGQIGCTFGALAVGSLLGFFSNMHQEALYRKYFPTRGPEARLHWACFAAVLLPASMLMYAWSSLGGLYWIVQVIAITLFTWATFIIYLAVFSYFADCYGPYASSALAGQSLARNIFAAAFPLFTSQMYDALGYKWANVLFALIAIALIPVPYILYFYGPVVRSKSSFSRQVIESGA